MRKLFTVGAATLAAGALVGFNTPLAHAQLELVPLSDLIVFTGTATIQTDGPTVPLPPHIPPDCTDPQDVNEPPGQDGTAHVDLIGGCGTFTFTSDQCVGYSDPTPSNGLEVGNCTLSANGNFTNIVCGTGTAGGGAGLAAAFDNGGASTFSIVFVATIGIVTGTFNDPGTPGDPSDGVDLLVGVVLLGPAGNGPLPDGPPDCTDKFGITGAVVGLDV